jgi:hypothetical protein
MSSHETRVWETPDEEQLASLMNNVSELLVPQEGYSLDLKLSGVMPDDDTYIRMGQRFQAYLNEASGSSFHMTLDGESNELIMTEFSAPLAKDRGYIHLQRIAPGETPPYDYLPSVNVLGKYHEAKEPAWSPGWHENLSKKIVNGHDLDVYLPIGSHDQYHMMLGHNILSKSRDWLLLEKLDLGYHILGKYATRVSVARKQIVPEDALLCSETLSISYEMKDLSKDSGTMTTKQQLELISHQNDRRFVRTSIRKPDIEQSRANKKFSARGAEAKDITYFTNVVKRVLSSKD